MFDRGASNLATHIFGLGGILLGVVGLVWGDFAGVWQPIQALGNVPHRTALAYIVAILFLVAGVATQWQHTAQAGLVVLGALHFMSALLWLPRVIGFPRIYGTWAGFAEQFSMLPAAIVGCALLTTGDSAWAGKTAKIGRFLYGLCVVSYGLAHLTAIPQTASMVPKWIPPGQRFWAIATGVAFLLAAFAILSGICAALATRLLTAMIITFGALVWAPALAANPRVHMVWAGNAINLSLIGAAWIIADSIASASAARR